MVFLCVQWFEVRGDCSFCWYWLNCWPSLFKLSFHNTSKGYTWVPLCIRLKLVTFVCLSQARSLISTRIGDGFFVCSLNWGERLLIVLLIFMKLLTVTFFLLFISLFHRYTHTYSFYPLLYGFNPATFVCCTKPGYEFPTSYIVVIFVFSELGTEVIVCFVDIGGIIDHHCLIFLFIKS